MGNKDFQSFLKANITVREALEKSAARRSVGKGQMIVAQGEVGQDIYVLKRGKAKVVIFSEGGHEVRLADFSPGTLFGEMSVLTGSARSSNVLALTACDLDVISATNFMDVMKFHPELSDFMITLLAERLQKTSQNLFETFAFSVPQRLYEDVTRRATQSLEDPEIYTLVPAPSVTSLSDALNVSREAASRAVTKLEKRGLIIRDKKSWNIIRPEFGDI